MSNLTLKPSDPVSLRNMRGEKLGHNTTVERQGDGFLIRYHGNAIAYIGTWDVSISNAGWTTPTTRERLNIILRSNGIPAGVFQRDFNQYLRWDGRDIPFHGSASFDMVSGTWNLIES